MFDSAVEAWAHSRCPPCKFWRWIGELGGRGKVEPKAGCGWFLCRRVGGGWPTDSGRGGRFSVGLVHVC